MGYSSSLTKCNRGSVVKLHKTVWHAAVMAFCVAASSAGSAQVKPTGLGLDDGPDPYGRPLMRTIASIVEYSRWPSEHQIVRLCVAGSSDHAGRFDNQALSGGRQLRTVELAPGSVGLERCDVAYLGRLSAAEQRGIVAELQGKPVLTIAENDPACRTGSMICLLFEADEMSFRINLDAISRSQVRIDPRVLRMADGPGGN